MQMFTRTAVLRGPLDEITDWVSAITERVTEVTTRETACWASLAGGPAGTHTWAQQQDGAAQQIEGAMALSADDRYTELLVRGRELIRDAPVDATFAPLTDLPPDTTRPGNVLMVTETQAAPGSLGAAMSWGQEVCRFVEKVAGTEPVLLSATTGPFSQLLFMIVHRDGQHLDEASSALRDDPGYLDLLGRGGGHFTAGLSRTSTHVRVA